MTSGAEIGIGVGYPDDILGEVCDRAVQTGSTFIQHHDGSLEISRDKFTNTTPLLDHNTGLVEPLIDERGNVAVCVTPTSSANQELGPASNITHLINRLMPDLPTNYLVFSDRSASTYYKQPEKLEPLGVRINAIPDVRQLIENAHTSIPQGATHYPKGALVLSPDDKLTLLSFFSSVLRPQVPKKTLEPEPIVAQPLVTAQQMPETIQPTSRRKSERKHLRYRLASYALTLWAGGWTTYGMIEAANSSNSSITRAVVGGLCIVEAGLCSGLTLSAYDASEDRSIIQSNSTH